jgi:hypothetical protein
MSLYASSGVFLSCSADIIGLECSTLLHTVAVKREDELECTETCLEEETGPITLDGIDASCRERYIDGRLLRPLIRVFSVV